MIESLAGLHAGDDVPGRVVPVSQVDIIRFAGASGDFNPLHFDSERAATAGFRAPIAMGQMTAALLASWISDWCGIERLRVLEVRFVAPVLAGDTVDLTGKVTDVDGDGHPSWVELEVVASVEGRQVLTGTARIADTGGADTAC